MKPGRFLSGLWFRVRRAPGVLRRFKFWILAGMFLLAMVALGPVLGPLAQLLTSAARGLGRILMPVLDSKVGRFVLVNVLLVLAAVVLYRRFKNRAKRLLGSWALDRFLAGMLQLAGGRYGRAAKRFEKVVRVGRLVDLETAVPVYPEILADARIKLALCYREMGEVEKAMRSLELLKTKDLPPAVRRDLAEAKAFVYSQSDELMRETIDREIEEALGSDGGNRRLLRLRRDRAVAAGDLAAGIEAQRRLLKSVGKREKAEAKRRLAILHVRNALELMRGGRQEEALAEISRSRSHDAELALAGLVAGDIAAARGDLREAVREWAACGSTAGLERVRAVLEEGKLDGEDDLEHVALAFGNAGILLVLGEHFLSRDDHRRAANCVRKYEELGLADRRSAHLGAEVLHRRGEAAAGERRAWQALTGFLGADPSRSESV